jgi:arsenate reductase
VITVCDNANERCPYFPGKTHRLHHNFTDPAKATGTPEEVKAVFRSVRDEIKEYSKAFIEQNI